MLDIMSGTGLMEQLIFFVVDLLFLPKFCQGLTAGNLVYREEIPNLVFFHLFVDRALRIKRSIFTKQRLQMMLDLFLN